MKLALFTRYDRLGASSRLRSLQFLPALRAAGMETSVFPLLGDGYLRSLYAGKGRALAAAGALVKRMSTLLTLPRPDLIWFEKELLPWLPAALERMLLPAGVPYVCDYDDAVFHRYDLHRSGLVRSVLGHKIDRLMAGASLVTAGNAYLAARARSAGASNVAVIPTTVDIEAYHAGRRPPPDGRMRIGWIGTPGTWNRYMEPLLPCLAVVATDHGARFRIIGGGPQASELVESLAWSEAEEGRMIQGMDIGLMPLDDTPWSQGKCGYKLIQYMACALPVIASPVGVNTEIVQHGVNGFLATTDAEWRNALSALLSDPELRGRMGRAGRALVERRYTLQAWGPRLAALLHDTATTAGIRR